MCTSGVASVSSSFLGQNGPTHERVREIAWLDDSRLGAIVRRKAGVGENRRAIDFVSSSKDDGLSGRLDLEPGV